MSKLNASVFSPAFSVYKIEFESILSKMIVCFNIMLENNFMLSINENYIRDVYILNYLKNQQLRNSVGLSSYDFEREVPEDHSVGRIDIKIISSNTFIDPKEYYTLECKLIDDRNQKGVTGLNAKYISNGICRFTTGYYHVSSKLINGMFGFVVSKMDIKQNVDYINYLQTVELRNCNNTVVNPNTIVFLTQSEFADGLEYQYTSKHKRDDGNIIELYHLMFDCSNNISI